MTMRRQTLTGTDGTMTDKQAIDCRFPAADLVAVITSADRAVGLAGDAAASAAQLMAGRLVSSSRMHTAPFVYRSTLSASSPVASTGIPKSRSRVRRLWVHATTATTVLAIWS